MFLCSIHTTKDVKEWMKMKEIKILENRPSQSLDLNPMRHLWSELEMRKGIGGCFKEEWNQIPNDILLNLIESMSQRNEACIANNGWPTKYYFIYGLINKC